MHAMKFISNINLFSLLLTKHAHATVACAIQINALVCLPAFVSMLVLMNTVAEEPTPSLEATATDAW